MEEMLDKIVKIEEKYTELGEILSKPEIIQDYNKFRDLSKQRKSMETAQSRRLCSTIAEITTRKHFFKKM